LTVSTDRFSGKPATLKEAAKVGQTAVIVVRSKVPTVSPMSWMASNRPSDPAMVMIRNLNEA
jgi:hypothetical protein